MFPVRPSRSELIAVHADLLHFRADPGAQGDAAAYEYLPGGLLVVDQGKTVQIGPYDQVEPSLPEHALMLDYSGCLCVPGFVDTHTHFPQTDMIAAPGANLLDWLERYTFPHEARFADERHAAAVADFFLDELLSNGTTTAMVFGSVHGQAAAAFFSAAQRRALRMLAGKVLMDRNCPENLRDAPGGGYGETAALIEIWHGRDRLEYAITPRFAATSSVAQMRALAELAADYPDVPIQSHVAENRAEVAWVAQLFPGARSYLDVYDQYGLLRPRAVYAHCIHLDAADRARMAAAGAAAAFCPSSNLFLGSGLFDLAAMRAAGVHIGLGTDVGAGTSFSMLRTMADAYKVTQLQGQTLRALQAWYLATLGGARALGLQDRIGSFDSGREADFVVLDPRATPLLARRMEQATSLEERLFILMTLGDDRCVRATHILGAPAYLREAV
ncbi:MAG: guanine deaminase [Rhodocyclaceae bacterium]|nr:guanine deaminase [Rhodocyclaceae bacterium]MBX3667579.1 guanine deaminase [Rhodocyclaceae bacterium]